jgi:hypothetical protein
MTFTKPIARLKNPQDIPRQSAGPRQALYQYMALTGVSPDELSKVVVKIETAKGFGDPFSATSAAWRVALDVDYEVAAGVRMQ